MKKTILGGLGVLFLLTSVVTPQAVTATTDQSRSLENLIAGYETAKASFTSQRSALAKSEEYKKLREARDRDAMRKLLRKIKRPDAEYYVRFQALAKASEGTKVEIQALLWMLGHNRDKAKNVATLETLAARDIKAGFWSASVRQIPYYIGTKKGGDLLARLSKDHPDKDVRLMARYTRANAILRDKSSDDEAREAAKADVDDLIAKNPESVPALKKNGPLFVRTRLQIGMKAPDILAKDLDGNDIRLSDYLGRVVVINFWGDW